MRKATYVRRSDVYVCICTILRLPALPQVCEIVSENSDPEAAAQAMLQQALEIWEDRIASDNISMVVVKLEWGTEDLETSCSSTSAEASTVAEREPAAPSTQ